MTVSVQSQQRASTTSFAPLVTANTSMELESLEDMVRQALPTDTVPHLERCQLQRISPLGRGASAKVYLVVDTESKQQMAMKSLDASRFSTSHDLLDAAGDLAREAAWLGRLQHPNLVQLKGVSSHLAASYQEEGFFILMNVLQETLKDRLQRWRKETDAAPRRKLLKFLQKKDSTNPSWQSTRERLETVAVGVVQGMKYLHEQGVVLRDLKPANIGFDAETGVVQLLDLGMARSTEEKAQDISGTPRYMAPEVMMGQGATTASDVYSFGMVLYELATLKIPFTQGRPTKKMAVTSLKGLRTLVVDAKTRPSVNTIPCPALQELIQDCWAHEPQRRPTFGQIEERLNQMLELESVKSNSKRLSRNASFESETSEQSFAQQ